MFSKIRFLTTTGLCLFFTCFTLAQLPYTQHPTPPGVVVNSARMNDLVVDAANNKWIAFGNYGVGIYDGSNWTMIDSTSGSLPTDSVTSIAFEASGNAWFGTKTGAVYKSGSTFTAYNNLNSGLPPSPVTKVYCEPGKTWFGTYAGLVSYDGNTWYTYNTGNSGLANDSVTCILRDGSGILWIGTRNGLSRYDNNSWLNYTPSNSILDSCIIDLETDSWNRLWVSCGVIGPLQSLTTTGVYILSNGTLNSFYSAYLNDEPQIGFMRGTAITRDASGSIYFMLYIFNQRGIVRINGASMDFFECYLYNAGMTSYGSLFAMDSGGLLWTVQRARFYLYSLDFNGYLPMFGGLTYKNHRLLNGNDVRAGINVSGDMHWDLANAEYEVPRGTGKHSVFASALWIGGLDAGGQLHTAAQTYRQTGSDYWPGPIGSISIPFDSSSCYQFDRIWKMDKWKIEEFKNAYSAGSVTNGTYQVPEEITSWPAKGNGVVNDHLAPFIDVNADGIYNPLNGDYPDIRGDQMLYYIFNDSLALHTETNGLKMGIEVQSRAYAYYCSNIADSNKVLNQTTLYKYTIINRSVYDYDSVYTGFWCDPDLGNAIDDYVGCDSTRATGFAYNGDNDDESSMGYGLNPPMQNVKVLRGTLADPGDGIDNNLDGVIDEPGERTAMNHFMYYNGVNNSPTGNPTGAINFYTYLQSIWMDGMHLTYGLDGRDPLAPLTNFMFSGVPYASTGWTEAISGNMPEDRRFIMGSGPVSLDAGDTLEFDIAYIFTRDSLNPNGLTTSIARNQADLDRVQHWFDIDSFPSCEQYVVGVPSKATSAEAILLLPNPAIDQIFVYIDGKIVMGLDYTILNLLGAEVSRGKLHHGGIEVGFLENQPYFLRIETPGGPMVRKFVKMD